MRVYYSLYGRLLTMEALYNGFKKVKKAKGAAGIDGQKPERLRLEFVWKSQTAIA